MHENHQRVVYYLARPGFLEVVKIGTTVNLPKRLKALAKKYGNLDVLGLELDTYGNPNVLALESKRHQDFRNSNISGEWFWVTPDLEKHLNTLSSELEDVFA